MRINYNKLNSSTFVKLASFVRKIGPLFPLVLLVFAIVVVRSLLKEFRFSELVAGLKAIPKINIFFALVLTILNYFMLTLYDYLGSRYVKAKIPIQKVALASFVAYAFSQNLGVSLLSGGAVRYRFYQKEGLSGSSIARIIGFTIFHFWLGLFVLAGILGIILPESFSGLFRVSALLVRLIGVGVLLPGAIYVFFLFFPNILARKYRRLIPRTKLGLLGLFVCVVDWILAASVFYCLLPGQHGITFLKTITVFIAAQVAGVISHVPGGLGVFEATVGFFLSPHHNNASIVSALIIFRSIYYFLPFILSIILMSTFELRLQYEKISQNKVKIAAGFEFLENLLFASSPIIGSILCIISGYSLLSSSVLPSDIIFPQIGKPLIPLLIFEASHFLSSFLGIILIFLGVGLRRRIESTWYVCFTLLTIGVFLSIGKDHNLETLFILFNLGFLYLTRKSFSRHSSFHGSLLAVRWAWTLGAVLFSVTIGFFSYEEIEYSNDLWIKFGVDDDAPRFLRSMIGMFFGLAFCGSYFVLAKPKEHVANFPTENDLPKIKEILNKHGSTIGYLSLTLDKEILYSEDREGFLMWRQSGSSMICFGDPQSSLEDFQELSWKFRELAEESSKICAFYEISASMIPCILDLGLRVFKIGEEGVVDLTTFSLKGGKWAKIRNTASKMRKDGISFSVLEKDQVRSRIHELREVSDRWLENKHVAEKGFSLGFFDEEFVSNFRCGIVEHEGKILGFANILESTAKSELSIDLMRHTDESPHGVMDFLFINLFSWGQENKYQAFSLGMAPLSGLSTNPLAPNYAKIGNVVFRHGGNFYNFEGLRKYKEKFEPTWVPRYLAVPNGLYLPIVLSNISVLISGGVKGLIKK